MRYSPRAYSINDFRGWHEKGELILAPKFQRRDVWTAKAKAYLIDTIIKGLPIPIIFMRQEVNLSSRRTRREVVDGQQRLRSVLEFVDNQWPVLHIHSREYGGKCFRNLPAVIQSNILNYEFSVSVLGSASDMDILDIFSRLNSYTEELTAQELRHAHFHGDFKKPVYDLARQHLEFWRNQRILTERQIVRMAEAELVSELIIGMLDGLQDKKKSIRDFYERYDDKFPQRARVVREFKVIIDIILSIWDRDGLSRTPLRRRDHLQPLQDQVDLTCTVTPPSSSVLIPCN